MATKDVQPGAPPPARTLPLMTLDMNEYWRGGEHGALRIYQCSDCAYYIHPPIRFCPQCESRAVEAQTVSGRGTVISYTVVEKQFVPDLPVPYVIALVGIDEQPDVQLPANIYNCAPESVFIGMRVKVYFEQVDDLWVPLFEPEDTE